MKNILLALPLAALFACGSDDSAKDAKDVMMNADFDSLVGWVPDPSTLTKEKAHSGAYSLKVDPTHEYSLTYSNTLGQLSGTRIRGIKVDAWAYLPSKDAAANLVFVLKDNVGGQDILNEQIGLLSQVKEYGKWVQISKEISFPASANYTSQLGVYLWRASSAVPVYVDDIRVTALR